MSFPRYPKYKGSGVEWFGDVPESWEIRRIKHLGRTITGGTPKTDEPEYWTDGDVPWLPSGKVQNGTIHKDDVDTFITKRALAESAAKPIKPGSALIALTGATCGNAAFLVFESTANQSVVGIEPKTNSNGRFIYYSLLAQREQVLTHKSGGAQGGINQEDVRNLVILAPEEAEQNVIADFLDQETQKIDKLVAEQRRMMELLKEKRQAVISHAVTKGLNPQAPMKPSGIEWLGDVPEGWMVTRIKRLCSVISKGTTPTTIGEEFKTHGIRFLKAENITETGVVSDPEFFISEETHAVLSRGALRSGDVLVVIAGATTGKSAVLIEGLLPANTNQAVSYLRLKNRQFSDFINLWLGTSYVRNLVLLDSVQAAQPNLSMEDLGNIPVPVPTDVELEQLITFLDTELAKFDTLTAEAQRAIDLLQERRTALISAAVTGQIDVRQ